MLDFLKRKKESDGTGHETFLIVGLGNPGREYRGNRHNIGFMAVEALAKQLGVAFSRVQSKALVTSTQYQGFRLVLAKPQTYMNLSGTAISGLVHFYKVPVDNLLVIHDDLDLPLGTLRMRPGGGSAGQKGLASTIARLGTQNFPRLRLGIGRPPGRMDPADYVLQDFPQADQEILNSVLSKASEAALVFVTQGLESAMNQFNGELSKG